MIQSILTSTKKTLGLDESYTAFDHDIITHINSVFSTLHQLGIGPPEGYMIEDATNVWSEFMGTDAPMNAVKTYMYLRVRLLFDPPPTGYLVDSMQKQIEQMEWRLNVEREGGAWTDPTPPSEEV